MIRTITGPGDVVRASERREVTEVTGRDTHGDAGNTGTHGEDRGPPGQVSRGVRPAKNSIAGAIVLSR